MPKLKAKWEVDKKALEDIHRGYEMNIEPGGLYEVWLLLEERPKPAVAICYLENIEAWETLVNGQVITIRPRRIFMTGTATPHPTALAEIQQMIANQIMYENDKSSWSLLVIQWRRTHEHPTYHIESSGKVK